MFNREYKLIWKLFFSSLSVFFLSTLTSTLGSLVDGVVIGNTMNTNSVAAYGLVTPLSFAFALIGSVLNSGSQNACAGALGRGDKEEAQKIFSLTCASGFGVSLVVMLAILLLSRPIVEALGAEPGTELFADTRAYLIGYALGLPAITGTKLLSSIMQLDSDRRRALTSVVTMTGVNVIGDLLCVYVLNGGLAGIALITSLSYYGGLGVLLLHFTRKNIIFRLSFSNLRWKDLGNIVRLGMPKGVSRVTSLFYGVFLNRILVSVTATAVAGYSVQASFNYLANAVVMGIAQSMMLLTAIYHGEENRDALRRVVRVSFWAELILTGSLAVLVYFFAPQITRLYLGSNLDAHADGILSLRWYAAGLLFQGFNILFADYLQSTRRIQPANLVYILENVVFTVLAVTWLFGTDSAEHVYQGVAAAHLLMFLAIPVFVMIRNHRPLRHQDDILMLNKDFGVSPEDQIAVTITSIEEVISLSRQLWNFCRKKGLDQRRTYLTSLAAEEMAGNIVVHGFSDRKRHNLVVRVICKNGEMVLTMRDDCRPFDPKERFQYLNSDDPSANIGLRMIMRIAREVSYSSAMKMNNLIIRI